jgi:stage II sporulation protein D
VLQRNYLATHGDRHEPVADLCDNTHCQRADTRPASRIYTAVDRASATGLSAGDGYPCYYSVNCGGSTLTPGQIWKHNEPGYSNVSCSHCRNSNRYRWERTAPATRTVQELLGRSPRPPFVDDDFKIRLGRAIGFNKVLSNTIDRIERRGAVYVIAGRGFGHRVGMCQEGARQLALHGWNADAILRFYFPAARVSLQR